MIDSHCHLADKAFADDLDAVLQRARDAGIDTMIAIADTLKEGEQCLKLSAKYDEIFCTIGVHPHVAKNWQAGDEGRLRALLQSSPKVKAVGEIGLDYFYDHSPREVQRQVFHTQLLLAKELTMPVVIHCRDAIGDLVPIVDEIAPKKAVLHCCTEQWEDVADWIAKGFMLSFTGIATYPKSTEVRRTIEQCPIEQFMIETDAPYLAPVPHRGERNEPAFVAEVARLIAKIKGMSFEEVGAITRRNTVAFFGLPS